MSKIRWPIARPPGIVVPKSQVLDGILRLLPPPSSLAQEGYRWRNDDGSEAAATFRQLQDVDDSIAKEINVRLRALIDATGDPASEQYQIEYKEDADPDVEYRKVSL